MEHRRRKRSSKLKETKEVEDVSMPGGPSQAIFHVDEEMSLTGESVKDEEEIYNISSELNMFRNIDKILEQTGNNAQKLSIKIKNQKI